MIICSIYENRTSIPFNQFAISFGTLPAGSVMCTAPTLALSAWGKLLLPIAGEVHTFHFKDVPGAGHISIDSNAPCTVKTYEKEEILPPEMKERYQNLISPEWYDGRWMYFYAKGKYEWRPITKGHIKQPPQQKK